jgi:hypothetical protein
MPLVPYATARARAANYAEMGKRVAPAINHGENRPAKSFLRAQTIVERGTYGDPGECDPPLSMRQQRIRDHGGPSVQPLGPRPWSSKPASGAAQLDLSGAESTLPPTPPSDPTPARRGQQLGLPVTVARSYRSKAWGGTVTEPPLGWETEADRDDVTTWKGPVTEDELDWPMHWKQREE